MTDVENTLPESKQDEAITDDALKAKRKKALAIVAVFVIIAIVYAIWTLFFNHSVSTDNAYVSAETASVTSMVSGQVEQVLVSDTQAVKKDDVLLLVDHRDAEIAVAQAEAELMKAKRQYKQTQANSSALNSQVFVSDDGIHSARSPGSQSPGRI